MTSQVFKDPNILKLLEWPIIEKRIQSFAHFNHTTNQHIFIFKSPKKIIDLYTSTNIFIQNIHEDFYRDLINAVRALREDFIIGDIVSLLEKSAFLTLDQLNEVAKLIEFYLDSFNALSRFEIIKDTKEAFQQYKRFYTQNFLKEFRSFISPDGEIDYYKHPLLRSLYIEQQELESDLRRTLGSIGQDSQYSNALQFNSYDIMNDRYVVPVKSDHYQSHLGQIISRSETGHTLYVEPSKVRNLNVKRMEVILKLQKEIEALSIRFSKSLHINANQLKQICYSVTKIDELNARASFANTYNLVEPKLTPKPFIKLVDFYHPLIENPIKNTIEIDHDQLGLIISGPNTGGKTAALKSITLAQLFARFGLFVPAAEACLHLYDEIFYFGNDGQSLPEGLSSFAAEVKNYTELFNNLGKTNLIVIDEIFNTTSSEEASALAISLFDQLDKISSSHLLVSTHHQMLKTFIHADSRYLSAHVGFNPETSRPTYKLYYGSPGGSQALKIFSLLTEANDVNKAILTNALKVLDKKMVSYEALLEKISAKENELAKTLAENREINIQLRNQKASMEGVYKLKLEEKIKQTDKDLAKILSKAENFFYNTKNGEFSSKRNFEKNKDEVKSLVNTLKIEEINEPIEVKYANMSKPRSIEVGQSYFSIFLGQTVTIKSINQKKKEALVGKGLMSIKCPLDSLRVANEKPKSKVQVSIAKSSQAKIEHDCRGMRLSEFQSLVEFAISDLIGGSIPFVTFIHGHGNGTLKSWLRSYIKNHSDLKEDVTETGNDGETKVILS